MHRGASFDALLFITCVCPSKHSQPKWQIASKVHKHLSETRQTHYETETVETAVISQFASENCKFIQTFKQNGRKGSYDDRFDAAWKLWHDQRIFCWNGKSKSAKVFTFEPDVGTLAPQNRKKILLAFKALSAFFLLYSTSLKAKNWKSWLRKTQKKILSLCFCVFGCRKCRYCSQFRLNHEFQPSAHKIWGGNRRVWIYAQPMG